MCYKAERILALLVKFGHVEKRDFVLLFSKAGT